MECDVILSKTKLAYTYLEYEALHLLRDRVGDFIAAVEH